MSEPRRSLGVDEALHALTQATMESNAAMTRLSTEVHHDTEARERKVELLEVAQRQTRKLLGLLGVILVLLFVVAVINAGNIHRTRQNAAVTRAIAEDTQSTYKLLLDCLDQRNGQCGQRNAVRTRAILDEVKLYELTGFYCARTNPLIEDPRGERFLACMKRLYPGGPELSGR